VQSNARLTAEALGYEIGLSPPAVQKRLKKLRETGVIMREIAVLSPKELGREMTVIVQVMLERESRMHLDAFKRSIAMHLSKIDGIEMDDRILLVGGSYGPRRGASFLEISLVGDLVSL
jgi:DNA-binding Lrp family transcriptional regulator